MSNRFRLRKLGWCCLVGAWLVWLLPFAYAVIVVGVAMRAAEQERQHQIRVGVPSEFVNSENLSDSVEVQQAMKAAPSGATAIGLLVSGPISAFLFMWSRRLRSTSATEVLASDTRRPVVYFRSFRQDSNSAYPLEQRILSSGRKQFLREEEEIVRCLKQIGPVVAIGNPEEKIPLAGASRLYSSNEEWQSVAHQLLSTATLVVYRFGSTPGFVWEVKRGRSHIEPERFVILVPPQDGCFPSIEYNRFREQVSDTLLLPETPKGPVVYFRNDWSPVIFGSWYRNFYKCLRQFASSRTN